MELNACVPTAAHEQPARNGEPRGFPTPTRRIEIWSERLLVHGYPPLPSLVEAALPATDSRYPLLLGCAKSLTYCHGQHRNLPSLRRREPDPPLEMSSVDAAHRDLASGDWVRVETAHGAMVARVRVVDALPAGAVFGQHGWWEPGPDGAPNDRRDPLAANFNRAVDTTRADPVSGSVALRATPCEVTKLET